MSTFFSGVQTYSWSGHRVNGTLTGNVTRSGNTVTLSGMSLDLAIPDGGAYGSDTLTFTVSGTGTTFSVTGSGTSLGSHSLNNASFSVGASDTSKSVSWSSSDGYSGSFTATFPAGGNAPSGGTISSKVPGTDYITLTGGVTSGGAGSTSVELVILEQPYTAAGIPQRFVPLPSGVLIGTATITNTSPASSGGITIGPNKHYYAGVYANNPYGDLRYNGGEVVTLPLQPQVTLGEFTTNTAEFSYTQPADGGYYNKTLEYSLDGGSTWNTIATITSGSASTGTFTTTGLTAGEHTILTRARTTAGSSENSVITWSSAGVRLIASDGTVGKEAVRLLVSVEGNATEATRLLVSKDGVATDNI